MLDPDEKIVMTRVAMDAGDKRLVAELENLVQAAGLAARNRVAHSAHTLNDLRGAVDSQAQYVRLLHPLVTPDLLRAANARESNIR
jgi:hypothetical protein